MGTHCFETHSSPGCTCTRRSKILTHSLFTTGKETERNRKQKETEKQQKNRKKQKVTESNRKKQKTQKTPQKSPRNPQIKARQRDRKKNIEIYWFQYLKSFAVNSIIYSLPSKYFHWLSLQQQHCMYCDLRSRTSIECFWIRCFKPANYCGKFVNKSLDLQYKSFFIKK